MCWCLIGWQEWYFYYIDVASGQEGGGAGEAADKGADGQPVEAVPGGDHWAHQFYSLEHARHKGQADDRQRNQMQLQSKWHTVQPLSVRPFIDLLPAQ